MSNCGLQAHRTALPSVWRWLKKLWQESPSSRPPPPQALPLYHYITLQVLTALIKLHTACFAASYTADTNKISTARTLQDVLTTRCQDPIAHFVFATPATATYVLAVLTTSQGLEQRLDADVKEAWILLAGRHACGNCVATATDSRGGTGRQDEALRPECTGGRRGERDAGGQPVMRMLQLCDAESVCVFVCSKHSRARESEREQCVCICVKEKGKESGTLPRLPAVLLSSWLTPPSPLCFAHSGQWYTDVGRRQQPILLEERPGGGDGGGHDLQYTSVVEGDEQEEQGGAGM